MADVIVPLTGWGRDGWNDLAWGEGSVTNSGATGNVGSVTVTADANVSVTGLAGTGSVGSTTVTADANVSVTGLAGTGSVGSVNRYGRR
jgi:hypothetical protein